MKQLSVTWQKIIVWLTGYLNVIAFFLAGGYVFFKTEEKEVQSSAKTVLALLLGFTGLDILRSLIYNLLSLSNVSYDTLNTISDVGLAITILKTVVFVVLFLLDLRGIKLTRASEEKTED